MAGQPAQPSTRDWPVGGLTVALHQEVHFEAEICQHLAANGWLYAEGDAAHFDRVNGLFTPDLLAWVEATQTESWLRLSKTHGAALPKVLAERVRKNLNERGTLDVLRRGVEMLGLKEPLSMAQFAGAGHQPHHPGSLRRESPAGGAAGDALAQQPEGRAGPGVVRQWHRSRHRRAQERLHAERARCGGPIPLRPTPAAQGRNAGALLGFPGGALVHFAVSQSEVMMSTRLAGPATNFLPFNRGNAGGAGNAPNPMALPQPTCGKRSGRAKAGWTSCTAIALASATTRSSSRRSYSRATTSLTPPGVWWPTCWPMVPVSAT